MKSFSRVYSRAAQEQLATWAPSDLDVEFTVPSVDLKKEQILAILGNREENGAGAHRERSRSILSNIAVTAWQPQEIDVQTPVKEIRTWDFAELPSEEDASAIQETWDEEPDPEKEAEEILRQARIQAQEIILEARASADKVLFQAQDEIDSEKKEGYQLGWKEARSEYAAALNAIHAVVAEVHQWQDSLTTQGEQILVEMLKDIAQTMFGDGVRLDANALQLNLNRVMEHAQKLGDLNIFLNTRDVELLDPSWSEYQLLITGNRVKIIPSEKITMGGCIVKGSMGMVDGRVETQLTAVMNTIEEIRGMKE